MDLSNRYDLNDPRSDRTCTITLTGHKNVVIHSAKVAVTRIAVSRVTDQEDIM